MVSLLSGDQDAISVYMQPLLSSMSNLSNATDSLVKSRMETLAKLKAYHEQCDTLSVNADSLSTQVDNLEPASLYDLAVRIEMLQVVI